MDAAPVPRVPPEPDLAALLTRVKQRLDRSSVKLSSILSQTVMVGLLALPVALHHERPAAAPAAVIAAPVRPLDPAILPRSVTTVRISAGPKRDQAETDMPPTAVGVAAPPDLAKPELAKPELIVGAKSALVPPIKRVVPVTPALPPKLAEVAAQITPQITPHTTAQAPVAAIPAQAPDATTTEPVVELTAPVGWSEAEVAMALRQCTAVLADHNAAFEHANPLSQGSCGTPAPIKLKAIGKLEVSLASPATMNCAVAAAVGNWVDRVLQPAAKDIFSSPVVRLVGTGAYTCRNRNGAADGPISEHAFANAFDISGFVLADGRTISVLGGWGRVARDDTSAAKVVAKVSPPAKPPLAPDSRSALKGPPVVPVAQPGQVASTPIVDAKPEVTSDAKFLRRIHSEACGIFGTVLGPEANDAHRNHLHFDLKERKGKAYCQ